jgi:hypothetical protein
MKGINKGKEGVKSKGRVAQIIFCYVERSRGISYY